MNNKKKTRFILSTSGALLFGLGVTILNPDMSWSAVGGIVILCFSTVVMMLRHDGDMPWNQ